ncbi:hypothetical protein ACFLRW_00410 [Acidobacteriota bacterium]
MKLHSQLSIVIQHMGFALVRAMEQTGGNKVRIIGAVKLREILVMKYGVTNASGSLDN